MLVDRLRSSAVLILVLVGLGYLDYHSRPGMEGVWLIPALLFFALGTCWDLISLLNKSGRQTRAFATLLATGLVCVSPCVPMLWPLFGQTYPPNCPIGAIGWIAVAAVAAVFGALLIEMCQYKGGAAQPTGSVIDRVFSVVFVSLYVGIPFSMMVLIRQLNSETQPTWGLWALLVFIAVTKSADAGAYFVGRAAGRTKLVPRLSPKKTWEGAVGGVLTATIVAFGCLHGLISYVPADMAAEGNAGVTTVTLLLRAGGLGAILMVAGLIGDLAESLIKREAGAKDSGNWLPGLGGVWDVTDSLLAASMPAFVLLASGIAG